MKRGQAWGLDLMIASSLFVLGILVFFLYAINTSKPETDIIQDMTYEGGLISDDLMSPGFPDNWNEQNVVKIGILSDNKINQTKLELFYNLSNSDYQKTRALFDTKYNYFVNLTSGITIDSNQIEGIGQFDSNPENLIKITRFTIYENRPVTLNVYIWK